MFIARNASQLSCTPIFYLVPEKGHSGLQLKGMNLTSVTTFGKILLFGPKMLARAIFIPSVYLLLGEFLPIFSKLIYYRDE